MSPQWAGTVCDGSMSAEGGFEGGSSGEGLLEERMGLLIARTMPRRGG